jgi:hypothetical protein
VVAIDGLEVRRPAAEGARQVFGEPAVQLGDAGSVGGGEEDLQAWSPLVVGRTGSVETEDLGAGPDAGSGVPHVLEERPDCLGVEGAGELETGNEHPGIVAGAIGQGTRILWRQ